MRLGIASSQGSCFSLAPESSSLGMVKEKGPAIRYPGASSRFMGEQMSAQLNCGNKYRKFKETIISAWLK